MSPLSNVSPFLALSLRVSLLFEAVLTVSSNEPMSTEAALKIASAS